MADLSRDEFEGWMRLIREDIRGTHDRLDELNGRTRVNEQNIAILQDRNLQATKDPMARWTGFAGSALAVASLIWQQFHRP